MPLKQQKLPNSDYQQSSWARGYWSNNFLEKRATTTFFQLCHWRKQKSVNLQHLRRMCEMCCSMKKRRAGEGTDGGEEEEEEEDCCNQGWALLEVQTDAPVVLDEVLFSCWAAKLFIHKPPTACGHGRENCYTYCSFSLISRCITSAPLYPKLSNNKKYQSKTNDASLWLSLDVIASFVADPAAKSRNNRRVRSALRSKVNYAAWIHQIRSPADRTRLWHHQ